MSLYDTFISATLSFSLVSPVPSKVHSTTPIELSEIILKMANVTEHFLNNLQEYKVSNIGICCRKWNKPTRRLWREKTLA